MVTGVQTCALPILFTEEAIPILSDFFNKYSLNYEYTIIKDNGTIRKTDNRFRPLDS